MIIVGAGLAGLLAARAWPTAEVLEAEDAPRASHRALLRFRSLAVAQMTGIEFAPAMVRKGVWWRGAFVAPDIRLSNFYSAKTLGHFIGDRSIWNLEPAARFIAPEDLYEQLVTSVSPRIRWGTRYSWSTSRPASPLISTAPLPVTLEECGMKSPPLHRAPIRVDRFRISGATVFQTVYFPDPDTHLYRASITGSLLICESIPYPPDDTRKIEIRLFPALEAFGLGEMPEAIDSVEQRYGKIIPLPDVERKALLHKLTVERNLYSLGRFATWRNCLLDDVVQDIAVIRRLMRASDYDRSMFSIQP